ncbi:Protein of unknown function DUF99 [Halorhabdus tiamatea SARL4B]|uniref:UPF0215 protein HLRTI_000325 n=1 Tax=Halorhabdus tiamatea SARL4B TaxID=1033806 RepID=F7PK44_9EURY|nr:DUF99 family protein [Halorhabdus tiamatea]ERJ07577.1 Protein of unknown function DUF99 [Halorhabdus tiamatea SARL4B]CCQ33473.1 conserved hypothetical protein (DUF99) [Halorhabdus tiamatea SARL4B]
MKSGVRALGVAESYTGDSSTLAGAVVRASRVTDGFVFGSCAVGGSDATDAIVEMVDRLDRPDVRLLLVAGIAPAWFNVIDLHRIHDETGLPVLSITFEESEGLEPTLREEFSGEALAWRLDTYRAQPERERVSVDDETVFVRSVGCDAGEAREVVRAFTPEGGRPEPLRVARLAARAADGAFDSAKR